VIMSTVVQAPTRSKKRVIHLLVEQKQAIIQRAVTRGLDQNVRFKATGVDWLGEVPEHWTVMPLKRCLASMEYGISDPGTDAGRVKVVGMGNIRDGKVTVPSKGGVDTVDPRLLLRAGDLLFNRTNSADLVGKVGLFSGSAFETTFASYLVRLRTGCDANAEFLNYLLNSPSVLRPARQLAIPSLHQSNLNSSRYGRIQIALPPLAEQQNIATQLHSELAGIESSIENVRREIDLIREYWERLVADVVTGKLDVRAARLRDTETPTEPEALIGEDQIEDDELVGLEEG